MPCQKKSGAVPKICCAEKSCSVNRAKKVICCGRVKQNDADATDHKRLTCVLKMMPCSTLFLQVFDVHINNLVAVKQLDIYDKVGKGVAHNEYIPFTIAKGQLLFESRMSRFLGVLTVEFVKVSTNLATQA